MAQGKEKSLYAGTEPADERLLLLVFLKRLPRLALIILVGTLILWGAYYLRYVVFGEETRFQATSYFQIHYEVPLTESDYYINSNSWNIYIHSDAVTDGVLDLLEQMDLSLTKEELIAETEATMESDLTILTLITTTDNPASASTIAMALEEVMKEKIAELNDGVRELELMDSAKMSRKEPDVRPVRAFVLALILMTFFTLVIWLLAEISADSIYLPKTLRRRYGLPAIGTEDGEVLAAHLEFLFRGKEKIAVLPATEDLDPFEVKKELVEILKGKEPAGDRLIPMPAPLLCREAVESLREMDGVLLAVPAGRHMGKPLERVLEFLEVQEIPVTAAVLWNADEKLIRNYYRMGGREETE